MSDPGLADPVESVSIRTAVPVLMLTGRSVVEPKLAMPLTTHVPMVAPPTEITKLSTLPAPGALSMAQ